MSVARHLSSLALISITACSSTQAVEGASPASCDPSALPEALEIGEGTRVELALEAEGAVEVSSEGLEVEAPDGGRVIVRAPYGAKDATLRASCGGTTRETAIHVRPLRWTRVVERSGAEGAPPREYFSLWLDPESPDRLFVFGGFHYRPVQYTPAQDLWSLDLRTARWTRLDQAGAIPLAPGGRAVPLPGERALLFFGGSTTETAGSPLRTTPVLRRLDYAGTPTWTAAPFEAEAPGSYTGAFVHDAKRDRWLSICGLDVTGGAGLNCNVDAWDPRSGWTRVAVADGPKPKGRYGFAYALDAASDRFVVFGGQIGPANGAIAGDTWALELGETPPRWVQLSAEDPVATRRRNPAWAFDEDGQRLFVFGGTSDGRTSIDGIQVLSLERGREAWTSLATPPEAPKRTSGMGVWSKAERCLYFGFGNDSALFSDVLRLSL